jgi:hypothetical protein
MRPWEALRPSPPNGQAERSEVPAGSMDSTRHRGRMSGRTSTRSNGGDYRGNDWLPADRAGEPLSRRWAGLQSRRVSNFTGTAFQVARFMAPHSPHAS